MNTLVDIVSVLVILCLLGAMLFGTRALKARKTGQNEEKKKNLKYTILFLAGYALLHILRLYLNGNLL